MGHDDRETRPRSIPSWMTGLPAGFLDAARKNPVPDPHAAHRWDGTEESGRMGWPGGPTRNAAGHRAGRRSIGPEPGPGEVRPAPGWPGRVFRWFVSSGPLGRDTVNAGLRAR